MMQEKQEQPRTCSLWFEAVPISFSECYTAASHNRFRQGAVETSPNIPQEKGVTHVTNLPPDPEGPFYQDFIFETLTHPTA